MKEFKDYRVKSRETWGTREDGLSTEQINTGNMLRIADALEMISSGLTRVITNNEYLEKRINQLESSRNYYKRKSERR